MEQKQIPGKLIEIVTNVIDRPAMFQVNCVEDIYLVIFGYKCAIHGDELNVINDFLLGFRTFVNTDLATGEDHDWVRLIRFYSASNSHSIELFGQYLNKYLSE